VTKKMGFLYVMSALAAFVFISIKREESRRDALPPAQRAAEDSARAVLSKASDDSAKTARERSPGHQKGLAEFALRRRMKDPDAVQFQNEQMYTRGDSLIVCGEYNAKNGFGAYNGFKPFFAMSGAVITQEDAKPLGAKLVNMAFALCESR